MKCQRITPDGDGDIQRVLGAELRDFQRHVGSVHNRLIHPIHLVAEDQSIFLSLGEFRREFLQTDRIDGLLHTDDLIPH